MTVGELRAFLSGQPDDAQVVVQLNGSDITMWTGPVAVAVEWGSACAGEDRSTMGQEVFATFLEDMSPEDAREFWDVSRRSRTSRRPSSSGRFVSIPSTTGREYEGHAASQTETRSP